VRERDETWRFSASKMGTVTRPVMAVVAPEEEWMLSSEAGRRTKKNTTYCPGFGALTHIISCQLRCWCDFQPV